MTLSCILCHAHASFFHDDGRRIFHQCENCRIVFCAPEFLPKPEQERMRYLKHRNDVNDERYRAFVKPVVSAITKDFTPACHGLDFGAGTSPVVSKLLSEHGFKIEPYDPFFANFPGLLEKQYDFIICCEVMEHFHHPRKEFTLLKSLLLPGGRLYCMTAMHSEVINFGNWYYKNDPTHVVFYHEYTLESIKKMFAFSAVKVQDRLAVFCN